MTTYSIRTDAVSTSIEAASADEAAAKFAASEGIKATTLDELVAHVEGIDGAWLIVAEDGIHIVRTGDLD